MEGGIITTLYRGKDMKSYARNLRHIEEHQYSDFNRSKMIMPSSKHAGQKRKRYMRPFKKSLRRKLKDEVLKAME